MNRVRSRPWLVAWACFFCTPIFFSCTRGEVSRFVGGQRSEDDGGLAGISTSRGVNSLAAEEIAAELQFAPVTATWLGDHRFDERLDDVRAEAVTRELARLGVMRERVRRAQDESDGQDAGQKLDLRLLSSRVENQILELSDPSPYERNPAFYMNLVAFAIDGLLSPDFIPTEGRVRPLARRLAAVPELCREAEKNLKNPPELFTRRAIDLGMMTRDFLNTLLPRLIRGATDPKVVDEFNHSNDEARKALDEFVTWMNHDLLPRSKGDWVLGRDRLLTRLRTAELLDVSLETLQAVAERELKDSRRRLEAVAHRINLVGSSGGRQIGDALRTLEDDHPRADELMHTAETTLAGLYDAVSRESLLSLPPARPKVEEMPPYRWGYATLVLSGPLETRSHEAFFYIDPVDPGWKDKKKILDHLRLLNRTQLLFTSIHEVVPGHMVQQEVARHANLSLLRQRTRSQGFIEGWAHYAEELMTDSWPAPGNDREALSAAVDARLELLTRRVQVSRLGRLLVALRLHAPPAGNGPGPAARLEDAVRFLSEDCYMDEYAARREAEHMTYDPMSLLPALGRMQLLQLREDYRTEQGDKFSLATFHDALLKSGELPVVALRQLLLTRPGLSLQ